MSVLVLFGSGACIKNELTTWTGAQAEIDQTTWNANAAGLTYPILTRVPAANRALTTGCPDSTLRRYPQTIRLRINLVGPQSGSPQTVLYETFTTPIATVAFPATIGANAGLGCPSAQSPAAAAATLTVTDAVAGTHYTALSGTATIPANSSFGYIDIPILNPGATAASGRFLGIRLKDGGSLKVSTNYKEIGLVIDQR